jgi:hypothetical protein
MISGHLRGVAIEVNRSATARRLMLIWNVFGRSPLAVWYASRVFIHRWYWVKARWSYVDVLSSLKLVHSLLSRAQGRPGQI